MSKHLHLLSTKTSALQNSNDELSFFAVVSLFGLIQSIKFVQSGLVSHLNRCQYQVLKADGLHSIFLPRMYMPYIRISK